MSQTEVSTWTIGVDVGGTKVAAAFVDPKGEIQQHIRVPMNSHGTAEEGLASVTAAIDEVLKLAPDARSATRRIGICAPGPLDPHTGVVLNPPNVPCWRNFPLAAAIAKRYGGVVKVENDAKAAGLAEALWGAGRGYKNVFYATLGTGIGTGILFDKHIYHGRTGAAAEGGHVTIDYNGPRCMCGKKGCIEVLASGTAIGKRARGKLVEGTTRGSAMLQLAGGDINAVTSETVGKAYAAGDPLAKEVLLETVELLTIWLGNMVDLLEPDVMILGGGVAVMLSPFIEEIRKQLPAWCLNSRCLEIPIVMARYGSESGIAGGAALCTIPRAAD
ncbi:MAG TPA: ROK family protein [Methylomirabilota bacterium]|nr:ROK family protein [Methylomirabilota bacterium]